MDNGQFAIEQELRVEAEAAGVIDVDLLQFVDRSKIHYLAADNMVAGAKEAVQELKSRKPAFFAAEAEASPATANLRETVKPGSPEHKSAEASFFARHQGVHGESTSPAPTANLRDSIKPGSAEHKAAERNFLARYR